MPWYEDWFDSPLYEVVYRTRDDADAERLADVVERAAQPAPGSAILDVGTGRGRHARVFARRGYDVVGLDLSETAIATARQRSEAEGLAERTRFVVGDMRLPHFQARFDGVVNLFSTFGYFSDPADHQRAVTSMAGALVPGGWLVQDLLHPAALRRALVPRDARTVGDVHVVQERQLREDAPGGPRVEKRIRLVPEGGGEPVEFEESVRLFEPAEARALHEAAGLRVEAMLGDYDGGALGPESPRLIVVSRRPS